MFTIISVADQKYFDLLRRMVKSAAINFPTASIFVELVGMKAKMLDVLQNVNSKCKGEISNPGLRDHELANYCTNRRGVLLNRLRKSEDGHLIWLDADSLIRARCKGLKKHLIACDLTMRAKKTLGTFAAGTIGVSNNPICYEMLERYQQLIDNDSSWMSNQLNLNRIWVEYKDRLRFAALPGIYCDVKMRDNSVIWAAKSARKTSARFLKESLKFD